jgi:hypothetical protein
MNDLIVAFLMDCVQEMSWECASKVGAHHIAHAIFLCAIVNPVMDVAQDLLMHLMEAYSPTEKVTKPSSPPPLAVMIIMSG